MKDLELIWESYEFHTSQILELENDLILKTIEAQKILKKGLEEEVNSTDFRFEKVNILNKIIDLSNKLDISYKKQCNLLDEIIEAHNYRSLNGIPIPAEREVSISLLEKLKSETKILISETKNQKDEFYKIFKIFP